jgi:hypothetical protein
MMVVGALAYEVRRMGEGLKRTVIASVWDSLANTMAVKDYEGHCIKKGDGDFEY